MITKILAAIFFSYYFINIAGIPSKIKQLLKFKIGRRLKPFDCMTCLSAWTGLALYFLPQSITDIFCIMFIGGYIASKIK